MKNFENFNAFEYPKYEQFPKNIILKFLILKEETLFFLLYKIIATYKRFCPRKQKKMRFWNKLSLPQCSSSERSLHSEIPLQRAEIGMHVFSE